MSCSYRGVATKRVAHTVMTRPDTGTTARIAAVRTFSELALAAKSESPSRSGPHALPGA